MKVGAGGLATFKGHEADGATTVLLELCIAHETCYPEFLRINIGADKDMTRGRFAHRFKLRTDTIAFCVRGCEPGVFHGATGYCTHGYDLREYVALFVR